MIIGVTGRIATGKSTLSEIISGFGFVLLDADEIYHDLLNNSEKMKEKLKQHFSSLDRKTILKKITGDRKEYLRLNEITHPYVTSVIKNRIDADKDSDYVLDVPVPVKDGFIDLCDHIFVTDCRNGTQIRRMKERNGINSEDAGKLMDLQESRQHYRNLADYVLLTDDMERVDLTEAFTELYGSISRK